METITAIKQKTFRYDDVKHLYTLDGVPLSGTTTLMKEVLPPPLAWWASGMALTGMGWIHPKQHKKDERIGKVTAWLEENADLFTSPEKWLAHLDLCYRAHDDNKKEAAGGGTAIHEAIEIAVKEAITNNGGYLYDSPYSDPAVERFASWGRGKRFVYSEVQVYSEKLWLGGTFDIVYEENGEYYIGDIKTSKDIYPSHFIQMGLYDLQQSENGFFSEDGRRLGDPLKIAGYTVINIPRVNEKVNQKTYCDTDGLRKLGRGLVDTYRVLQNLKEIC